MKTILAFILLIALIQSTDKEVINLKIKYHTDETCNQEIKLDNNEGTIELGDPISNLQCRKINLEKAEIELEETKNKVILNLEKLKKLKNKVMQKMMEQTNKQVIEGIDGLSEIINAERVNQKMTQVLQNMLKTKSVKILWTGACTDGTSNTSNNLDSSNNFSSFDNISSFDNFNTSNNFDTSDTSNTSTTSETKKEINGKITLYSDEKCNKAIELPGGLKIEETHELGERPLNLQCVQNDVIKSGLIDIDFTNGECLNEEKIEKLFKLFPVKQELMASLQNMKSVEISWKGACTRKVNETPNSRLSTGANSGLSTGPIIGIVIGCLVVLILIGVAAYFCCIKKEEKVIVNQY
jgi:hypothetical protein